MDGAQQVREPKRDAARSNLPQVVGIGAVRPGGRCESLGTCLAEQVVVPLPREVLRAVFVRKHVDL